jgi:DNA-directed RNA polymerase subunit RPC12/RpoP
MERSGMNQIDRLVSCNCHACIKEFNLRSGDGLWPLSTSKMILCPECGNKRCPKASDHRLQCTDSNDVGQVGSVYQ